MLRPPSEVAREIVSATAFDAMAVDNWKELGSRVIAADRRDVWRAACLAGADWCHKRADANARDSLFYEPGFINALRAAASELERLAESLAMEDSHAK